MARWQPNARERLERAALELFLEHGFDETTVPGITARAGLTTRTFHRHFADKREVLFAGEDEILALVADLIAKAPADLPPMEVIAGGFAPVAAIFEDRRDLLRRRREVVRGNDGLRERELRKMAALAEVVAGGLRDRGVDALTATLAAELGATVFRTSVQRWLDAPDGDLPATIEETLAALKPLIQHEGEEPAGSSPGGRVPA